MAEAKKIVQAHHQVDPKTRRKTAGRTYYRAAKKGAGREPQESLSAPTSRPANTKPRTPRAA